MRGKNYIISRKEKPKANINRWKGKLKQNKNKENIEKNEVKGKEREEGKLTLFFTSSIPHPPTCLTCPINLPLAAPSPASPSLRSNTIKK